MGAFARHADEVGFESLLTVEHVAVPVGYESRYPYSDTGRMPLPEDCELPDPLDLLAWLAARTERIRLGTGILVLPEHHPLQLAKRCATIDRLSGGRLFLGVGVGWMREEVEALGIDPDERGSRTDEAIDALRVIWQEDEPTFDGQHFRVRPGPQPPQARPADDPDPRRRPQPRRPPAGPANEATASSRSACPATRSTSAGRRSRRSPSRPAATRARSTLTMGGLLGDDDAITDAIDARRRASRPQHEDRRPRRAPPRHGRRRRPSLVAVTTPDPDADADVAR